MANEKMISSVLKEGEDVVISGMSGRFPESDSVDEFAQNLYNKVDMIVDDDRRWPTDLYNMTGRMGKLKAIDKFDGAFFGIMSKIGDTVDPQARILLETTYEAIVDAGINPQTLRGTETGVYIGLTTIGMPDGVPEEIQPDLASSLRESFLYYPGNAKTMYANRVSFVFDFKGPSMVIDTACSSSMVALDVAITDLRLGKCEQAIVGGAHINLQPFTNHMYQSGHVNSPDGKSKVWDEDANGFVRGETVACLFLQKKPNAKRIYATVLHSRTNIDGNKSQGMLFPSYELQKELLIKTYKEANVDPLKLTYFEAHGTGTKVGDVEEAKAIYNAYCVDRKEPLPIGLLKSSIGHGEGASAVASITKVIIAYENKCIPANLNLKKLKSRIAEMSPPLLPINDNLPYTPGIAGVNNFGIGGVNGHVLLDANHKELDENCLKIADKIPRLINVCARNQESLNQMFDFIEKNPNKITRDFLALITETMKTTPTLNSAGFPFKGSMIMKEVNGSDGQKSYQYKKQSSELISKTSKPVWFLFPGLGGQWPAMAKAFMPIDIFANKIEECAQILKPFNIDLKHMLLNDDKNSISTMINKFVTTTSMQIALVEVLKKLDITPDGIIGHSFGEIACAYADGCLTTEEALLTSYWRGVITESDNKIPKGLMAAVGLSYHETRKMCPKGVDVVCDNSKDSVTISGLYEETKAFIETLKQKHIFVRELDSSGIPYHSQYLQSSVERMTNVLRKVIPNPKKRSKIWISTSVPSNKPVEDELKNASAEYFVNNLVNHVLFYNALKTLPTDAIVIEIGPHALFSSIITKTLESVSYVPLAKRDQNHTNLELFLTSIGKLYELGLNPSIENLYPKVEFPVARNTQSLSSLIKWDHKDSYFVKKYPEFHFRATASDMNVTISTSLQDDAYLKDHCIDGRVLFPAAGYLMLAWRILASSHGKAWTDLPVVFENVQFRRPIFLSDAEKTKLIVRLHRTTGEFSILEGNNVSSYGRIYASDDSLRNQNYIYNKKTDNNENIELITLDANDVYKELRVRGYDYGPKFRGIQELRIEDLDKVYGNIEWTGNMIPFLDSLLQSQAIALPFRKIFVPVMISSVRCDPKKFFEAIEERKQIISVSNNSENENVNKQVFEINQQLEIRETESESENHKQELKQVVEKEEKIFQGIDEDVQYRSVLPFFTDLSLKMIVTYGIEINGLLAVPIPRKAATQGLQMESYKFIANEENDAIEEIDKKEITEYIEVCSTLAHKALKTFEINNYNNGNGYKKIGEELIQNYLKDTKEEHVMLKIFDKLIKSSKDENENINVNLREKNLKQLKTDFQNQTEYDMSRDLINRVSKNERFIRPLLDIVSENNIVKKEIKVLEINSSNDILAIEAENHLASAQVYSIIVDYTIANKSIESLDKEYKNKSFKLIECDQKQTSFPSGISTMDLIIYRDCQDFCDLKIDDFLQEVYDKIADKGFLLSIFRYKYTEPELVLNHIFNSDNGNKNYSINDYNLMKKMNDFKNAAQKLGFNIICRKTDSIGSIAILFRKIVLNDIIRAKDDVIIEIDSNYDKWLDVLKEKLKENSENKEIHNKESYIWLIGNDSSINGILGLANCLRQEPGGERIRCIFDYDKQMKLPVDFSSKPFSDILINDLATNVIRDGKLGTYRHLRVPKNQDKIKSNDYYLNIGPNGDLTSLQWFDFKNIKPNDTYINVDNRIIPQIRCNIYSTGLNFRDVMLASGRIIGGPEGLFYDCLIGTEFAGRRTDSGERVCGFSISRCIATSVDVREDLITPIPENWSMEDAVTIVTTYCTVWYGLIERAQMQKNESILIHSGCGGVGQAAIAVCQYYNCNIFTTVGNEEKKQFLMREYNIPEDHIFNSHDIQFEQQIMSKTKGKGVNLVLNSLTGEKLEASFRCVSDDGRFVEIGKYDLQMNKQLGMFAFLRNISFHGVTADRMLYLMENVPQKFFKWLHENSNNGCIKPINRTVFKPTEAEHAFRYMTTGQHIGKILIKMREEENPNKTLNRFNPSLELSATIKTYFNPKKVYIITGGLGGMGLELLHWMIFSGGRKFVLTSRSGVKTNYQRVILNRLRDLGQNYGMLKTEIIVSTHDSNTIEGSKRLLEDANRLGSIGGVFHLAVVLNPTLIENQTLETFRETCESKINTFYNLDKLTRISCPDLDYFVVFSSVICGKGFTGQTNYGFSNAVCERICEMRRRDGLHGLAIQWGPIGDVGLLADDENLDKIAGIVKQRMNSCLEVMDKFLQFPDSILSSTVRADRELLSGTSEDRLISQLWSALGVDPKTTPNHMTLGELGMESMFAVELQQGLEREYDLKLTLNDVKNITVKQMKDFQSGNKQILKNISKEMKVLKSNLNKIKFLIPTETHTRLNSEQNGNPIYFLPPVEGIFSVIENLAKKINRPVIGLNWTQDIKNMNNMKEISKYFTNLLKKLSPNGNYDIVGHSFGALIATKMLRKAPIGRAVIIDVFSNTNIEEEVNDEEYIFGTFLKLIQSVFFPETIKERISRDLSKIKSINEKLKKLSSELREFGGKGLIDNDMDEILRHTYERAKLIYNYRLKSTKKFKKMKQTLGKKLLQTNGKLFIIKPFEDLNESNLIEKISETYFLPEKDFEERLNIETMNANPDELFIGYYDKVAELINQYLK